MKESTKSKGFFDGIKIVRIPEDVDPIRLIPANIPPLNWVSIERPRHWFHGKPVKREDNDIQEDIKSLNM